MSKTTDPSWTPKGFLADLDAMSKPQRREAAKQLLALLAQAEQWQQRGATPQRWDELVAETKIRGERIHGYEHALREAGIEHPLGPQGVEDLAAMAQGRLEDLRAAEQQLAELRGETLATTRVNAAAEAQPPPEGNPTPEGSLA